MGLYNLIPVLFIIIISLGTLVALNKVLPIEQTANKYTNLDGLRGYLAILVFVHHSSIWYVFIQTGNWTYPASSIFNHFGQSSVTLFFMITSFLFLNKILESKNDSIDWKKLFLNRFFRIVPLYLVFCLVLFSIVLVYTKFQLTEPVLMLVKHLSQWLTFTISGQPDINNFQNTWIIGAGLTWSLCYEWMFYFLLPLIGFLLMKNKPSIILVVTTTLIFIGIFYLYQPNLIQLVAFGGGIIASIIKNNKTAIEIASNKISLFIGILCVVVAFLFFENPKSIESIALLSIFFIIVALGNKFGGIFTNKYSVIFGNISYSIYLLHGLILFITLFSIIGIEKVKNLTPLHYWILISTISIPVIIISYLSRKYIEIPAMNILKKKNQTT